MWQTDSFGPGAAVGMMAFMLLLHLFSADLVFIGVCECWRCCLTAMSNPFVNVCSDTLTHIALDISNVHVIICHCRKAADKSAPARQASPPKASSPRRRPTPPRSPPRRLPSPDSEDERGRQRSLQEVRLATILFLIS